MLRCNYPTNRRCEITATSHWLYTLRCTALFPHLRTVGLLILSLNIPCIRVQSGKHCHIAFGLAAIHYLLCIASTKRMWLCCPREFHAMGWGADFPAGSTHRVGYGIIYRNTANAYLCRKKIAFSNRFTVPKSETDRKGSRPTQ